MINDDSTCQELQRKKKIISAKGEFMKVTSSNKLSGFGITYENFVCVLNEVIALTPIKLKTSCTQGSVSESWLARRFELDSINSS